MSKAKRRARDAIVALLIALAPFAYKQATLGNQFIAGVTAAMMVTLVLIYRYADAKVIEAAREIADADDDGAVADDLKPVLRRVGRFIRRRVSAGRNSQS